MSQQLSPAVIIATKLFEGDVATANKVTTSTITELILRATENLELETDITKFVEQLQCLDCRDQLEIAHTNIADYDDLPTEIRAHSLIALATLAFTKKDYKLVLSYLGVVHQHVIVTTAGVFALEACAALKLNCFTVATNSFRNMLMCSDYDNVCDEKIRRFLATECTEQELEYPVSDVIELLNLPRI
jgi:hypothetical protein